MNIKNSIAFFGLVVLFLTSCKEEKLSAPCNQESYQIDQSKLSRNVLIIGIDGFRSDVLSTNNAPFLFSFAQEATTYFTNEHQVEYYTSSGPNWTSLLTGMHHEKHLVINNFFSLYDPEVAPPFFFHIEKAAPSIHTVSLCHWIPINGVILQDFADYSPLPPITDSAVFFEAKAMIEQSPSQEGDVIFLHFDDLDHFGHANGYHDTIPAYVQAVSMMDFYAEGLVAAVNAKRSLGEDWLIFIVSDHGGEGREHTDMPNVATVNKTIFFANHPSASFKSNYITTQADLAPTVLDFLGIKNAGFDCDTDGVSVIE